MASIARSGLSSTTIAGLGRPDLTSGPVLSQSLHIAPPAVPAAQPPQPFELFAERPVGEPA